MNIVPIKYWMVEGSGPYFTEEAALQANFLFFGGEDGHIRKKRAVALNADGDPSTNVVTANIDQTSPVKPQGSYPWF